jgi:hypothetical protein
MALSYIERNKTYTVTEILYGIALVDSSNYNGDAIKICKGNLYKLYRATSSDTCLYVSTNTDCFGFFTNKFKIIEPTKAAKILYGE